MKLPPESDIIFFGSPYSAKITLYISIRLSADKSSVFFDDGNFAMIIYNTKVMFIVESEHIFTYHLPCLCWDVTMYYLVLQLCLLKCKTCSAIFNVFYNVIIYINPINQFMCQELGYLFLFIFYVYGWHGVGQVPVFLRLPISPHVCPSLWSHLSLPCHLRMYSIFSHLAEFDFYFLASL